MELKNESAVLPVNHIRQSFNDNLNFINAKLQTLTLGQIVAGLIIFLLVGYAIGFFSRHKYKPSVAQQNMSAIRKFKSI